MKYKNVYGSCVRDLSVCQMVGTKKKRAVLWREEIDPLKKQFQDRHTTTYIQKYATRTAWIVTILHKGSEKIEDKVVYRHLCLKEI